MPKATTYLGIFSWLLIGASEKGTVSSAPLRRRRRTLVLRHSLGMLVTARNAPLARRLRCLRRTKQAMRATLRTSNEVPTIVMTMINTLGMSPARDSKSRGFWAVGGASSDERPMSVFGHCQVGSAQKSGARERAKQDQIKGQPPPKLPPSP